MKNVVAGSVECYWYLRKVQDLRADGKAPYERRFGRPFEGPIIFGAMVLNAIRFQHEINRNFINLARKSHLGSFSHDLLRRHTKKRISSLHLRLSSHNTRPSFHKDRIDRVAVQMILADLISAIPQFRMSPSADFSHLMNGIRKRSARQHR